MPAVKEMTLLEAERGEATPHAMAPINGNPDAVMGMIERLATNPQFNVDALDRLMQMHERGVARLAEESFNAAMTACQMAMRAIAADSYNPQTKSRYASYDGLDATLRPLYTEHGFALSFDTGDAPELLMVRVLCYVSHKDGHSRTYRADIPADGKGAKGGDVMTRTHAVGAAMSYGMRYLLKMIFNVAVGEADDDGNSASANAKPAPKPPEGFDQWRNDLIASADTGWASLSAACKASKESYREHLKAIDPQALNRLKDKARAADAAKEGR